jgi:hypothetical protein
MFRFSHRVFLIISILSVGNSKLYSQTLNFNFPNYGDTVIYETITPETPVNLNVSGSSLTWNLSPSHYWRSDTVYFNNPSQSQYYPLFQSSTIEYEITPQNWMNQEGITFLEQTLTGIFQVGAVFPTQIPNVNIAVPYINSLKEFELPVQLGNAFNDTAFLIGYANGNIFNVPYDSISLRSYTFRYDTIDSHGTLVLSDRSYPDVLRRKTIDAWVDSMFYYDANSSQWIFETVTENYENNIHYSWLGDSSDFILASVGVRSDTIESFQVVPQPFVPPPFVKLQIENLVDTITSGLSVPAFQVRAVLYPDSTTFTSFNGQVSLFFINGSNIISSPTAIAVDGIATFNNNYFSGLGGDTLTASADTFYAAKKEVYFLPQPPPNIYLEFVGLPDTLFANKNLSFQVFAKRVSDGTIATDFQDSIRVGTDFSIGVGLSHPMIEKAVNGIALFDSCWFTGQGLAKVFATSDTTQADTNYVRVYKRPQRFEFLNSSLTSYELTVAPTVNVYVKDEDNNQSYAYRDSVRIGKISGPGNVAGTLIKKSVQGHASFDDLIFTYPGTYKLLTFPDVDFLLPQIANDTITIQVDAYPWYQWNYSYADTLSEFVDRSTFWFWEANDDGFLSGTSRDWYSEVAQRFDFTGKARLTKVILYFAGYTQVNSVSDDYKIKVYNTGVQNINSMPAYIDSLPLQFLGEQLFNAADIEMGDFFIRQPTVVTFDTPIDITSDFHIALEGNNQFADDTLILWNSIPGNGMGENRTSRYAVTYGNLGPFWVADYLFRPTFDVDFMIMPVLEIDTSDFVTEQSELTFNDPEISIYPNPGNGIFNFNATSPFQKIEITDLSGRLVFINSFNLNNNNVVVDLQNVLSGLYYAQIYFSNGTSVKEKLVILKP